MLTETDKERYVRHLLIPEIGEDGQKRLKQAKVLVVGAGGLGGSLLYYLAASGIGKIGIVDFDSVVLSNLQRQILFTEDDIGKNKAELAVIRLQQLNSTLQYEAIPYKLDEQLAERLFPEYDLVVGATDNFQSRNIIDNFCGKYSKPYIHGSINEFECQVAVFHYHDRQSYQQLFSQVPADTGTPIGVFAPLVGLTGCLMAGEVIKIILNRGNILHSRLLIYNMLTHQWNIIQVQ